MKKGDIVLIPFPFTDLSGNKNRPALILAQNTRDVTIAFISSQLRWKEPTDILLTPTNGNGLKKDSLIRTNKIATVEKALVLGLLGKISSQQLLELD